MGVGEGVGTAVGSAVEGGADGAPVVGSTDGPDGGMETARLAEPPAPHPASTTTRRIARAGVERGMGVASRQFGRGVVGTRRRSACE
jgi:hypothetical protein